MCILAFFNVVASSQILPQEGSKGKEYFELRSEWTRRLGLQLVLKFASSAFFAQTGTKAFEASNGLGLS